MNKEITKTKPTSEMPETVTDVKIYQEGINLLYLAQQYGLAKLMTECAATYNLRASGAYTEEGKNSEQFLRTINMGLRSAQMRLRIAKQMQKTTLHRLGHSSDTFHFTEQSIRQVFGSVFEKRRNVTLDELYKASCDVQTFQNFLEGNADIRESEITKLLTTGSDKDDAPAPSLGDLFTMHDAIKKAGYKLRDDGVWIDPRTGEPMTRAQLAPFVDEETGLYLFKSTKKILADLKDKIVAQAEYVEYVHAYWEKNASPEMDRLMEEEQKNLTSLVDEIHHITRTLLFEED